MPSTNFEFIRKARPPFAELAELAERYALTDPASSLVKLRILGEQITGAIYWELRLRKPEDREFAALLTAPDFRQAVPQAIRDRLHALRKEGNKGAHGQNVDLKTAQWLLSEAHTVAAWFSVRCLNYGREAIPAFKPITQQEAPTPDTHAAIKALQDELEAKAKEAEDAAAALAQKESAYDALQREADELKALAEQGQRVVVALEIDEEATRHRMIDVALAEAGWDVGPKGLSTDQVGQEVEVDGQPTTTGKGYVDYVLWGRDGRPLAVVEAKRTARSVDEGRHQAKLYADALETQFGRRPAIFYTNGYDITLWDDAQGYAPRALFGFYSPDSLDYLVSFQRANRKALNTMTSDAEIAGRLYQIETIKRVSERLTQNHRAALIVQATGTGKTRTAVALTKMLMEAGWARRILFLCDRRELRKQAKSAFTNHLNEPITMVSKASKGDSANRIFVGTYPGMMQIFDSFDVGFFDVIIADESHRSVYNVYGDLFRYFDAIRIGLTATPVEFVSRNTFKLFGHQNQDPTAYYPLERAVEEGYLVPYEVVDYTTAFLRKGIRYDDLSDEQKAQLEEDGVDGETIDYDPHELDNAIFNKDTNRKILRNLMENGIKSATGDLPGKSIIFARSHPHAVLLGELFDEMYPMYGGRFCQVIAHKVERAESLIDDFKGEGTNPDLTIAISVDMLDTGVDVPEIVNLVFAKPVRSKVKFWQMIGRGTRLCPDLFGPGEHKTVFRIFDHWGNFAFFEQDKPEAEPTQAKSLMEKLFEARLKLAQTALDQSQIAAFELAAELISADIAALPRDTISVREKLQIVDRASPEAVHQFDATTVVTLRNEIAPLMKWRNIRGQGRSEAYAFDLLIAEMQIALATKSATFADLRGDLENRIALLRMNLNPVREKAATLTMLRDPAYWAAVSLADLETLRIDLRSIMQHKQTGGGGGAKPNVIDVEEDEDQVETETRLTRIRPIDLAVYRQRVIETLDRLFDESPTLQRIKRGEPVSEADMNALVSLVLTQNPNVDLRTLEEFYPTLAGHLDAIIRSLIGMDAEAVRARFEAFAQKYPGLTGKQVQFLSLLYSQIAKQGVIELSALYEGPFERLDPDGPDGVFVDEAQLDDLLEIVGSFQPPAKETETPA